MTAPRPPGTPIPNARAIAVAAVALVATGAIVLAVLAGGGPTSAASPSAVRSTVPVPAVVPGSYVALGDSFTSGPDIPAQLGPGTTPPAPTACLRSSRNYPSLTAEALGLQLVDVSCGGATTDDLDRPQGTGIPAQLSALRPSTALVSVGIGGNDLGFSSIASNCASYTPWGPTRVGWGCQAHYTDGGTDLLVTAATTVETKVAGVLARIRQRAPGAKVFVVGYPDIVPPSGPGCWPALPFRAADLGFLRGVAAELDAALAAAAAGAGDHYVDMAAPSGDHSVCAPEATRWVEPIVPEAGSYPLHPGATGMAGMATVLETAMESAGTR